MPSCQYIVWAPAWPQDREIDMTKGTWERRNKEESNNITILWNMLEVVTYFQNHISRDNYT